MAEIINLVAGAILFVAGIIAWIYDSISERKHRKEDTHGNT